MQVVKVLIEQRVQSLNRPFSYLANDDIHVEVGMRVLLTFNNRQLVAFVIGVEAVDKTIEQLTAETNINYRFIDKVLDQKPLLSTELLELSDRVASYYFAPRISVLQAMLPPSLRPSKGALRQPKIAYQPFLNLVDSSEENLTPKQIELIRLLTKTGPVAKKDYPHPSVIKKLIELKRIEIIYKEQHRLVHASAVEQKPPKLTKAQQNAVASIENAPHFVSLLEGVTGSGKTEVYLALAERYLQKGKTIIMLVPEIALTPMMVRMFINRFQTAVAVLHSDLTPAQKYDEYRRIAEGQCSIVVGVRSAIFAPLTNIGLIILDEEHVESYKQDGLPHYHAREVAIMRAQTAGAKVVLGSATPSLETRARALRGVYQHVVLPERINQKETPQHQIISLLDGSNLSPESALFSTALIEKIRDVLSKNEQAILLINRRGYATYVSCRNCNYVFKCPHDDSVLTYHYQDQMLKCHHCDHVEMYPKTCPECGSHYLNRTGFGTERVVEEVARLFPTARTLRLDADTAKMRSSVAKTLEQFAEHQADILIGTQMIAKGHDFPNVTLVGVILADLGLNFPSYRSAERTFQLIAQVVGRTGRKDKEGHAIIQTYMPTHYAIVLGAQQDYERFFADELRLRKLLTNPPFTFLISLTIQAKSDEHIDQAARTLASELSKKFGTDATVLGPTTPYIAFRKGLYGRQIMIKHRNYFLIKERLLDSLKPFKNHPTFQVIVNVDPLDI